MWRKILQVVGLIAAILSILPLAAADFWWIRILDFLHVYFTIFTFAAILLYFFTFKRGLIKDYIYIGILLACFVFQIFRIMDYIAIYPIEVQESTAQATIEQEILVYTANVLEKNDKKEELFKELDELQPDLIVFTETDSKWQGWIKNDMGDRYPYKVEFPLSNTYGMIMYSKLELVDSKVEFQVDPEIPSIHTKVRMKTGEMIQVYAIHPTPPMPQHNPKSTDRDQELMKTAILSYNSELPVIVLGDFNDVSWSDSTQLTKTIGKLLDVRIGRGIYTTFNAQNWFMRWPLDHILTTADFRHKESGTGVKYGSDHFPLWVKLTLESDKKQDQVADEPDEEDWKQAEKQLKKAGLESFTELPAGLKNILK
jgi:endonuclease/exonuclease/phosphatase (EEP) superfamily protein YafD